MNEHDADRRLGELLTRPLPEPDPAYVSRIVLAAQIDQKLRTARRHDLRRSVIECGAAIAVGASFFLLSQMNGAGFDGMIAPAGPAAAGLMMLILWAVVALPQYGEAQSAWRSDR